MLKQDVILQSMQGYSVTNGWDVVCAMSADRITELFKQKYEQGESSGMISKIETEVYNDLLEYTTKYIVQVGPPLISFVANDPNRCQMTMNVKQATVQVIVNDKVKRTVELSAEDCLKNGYKIQASLPFAVIKGSVDQDGDVQLNFNDGKYTVDLNLPKDMQSQFGSGLSVYFEEKADKGSYSLGRLAYKQIQDVVDLTPETFKVAIGVEPDAAVDTGCLMMFIKVKGGMMGESALPSCVLSGRGGTINNPIPEGKSAALIISSRLLFKTLESKYQEKIPQLKVAHRSDVIDSWKLECQDGSVSIPDESTLGSNQWWLQGSTIPYAPENGTKLNLSAVNNKLEVNWSYDWKVKWRHSILSVGTHDVDTTTGEASMAMRLQNLIDMSVNADQIIEFANRLEVTITAYGKSTSQEESFWQSFVGGDRTDAGRKIAGKVNAQLPDIRLNLKGISVFAVSNLLFPNDHIITYNADEVFVPGDLIIFGQTKERL